MFLLAKWRPPAPSRADRDYERIDARVSADQERSVARRRLNVLGGFAVMPTTHRCADPYVTCNILSWFANVRPPQALSGFARIESGSAHRACALSSSGCPTSDHRSSLKKRTSSPSRLRPAAPRPMIKPSSMRSAMTSEAR